MIRIKRFAFVLLMLLVLTGCQTTIPTPERVETNQSLIGGVSLGATKDQPDYTTGDLVYRDYKNGIKLEKGNELYIEKPHITSTGTGLISIWIYEHETQKEKKIADYISGSSISFVAAETGTYVIYAVTRNDDTCESVDLTSQGTIYANMKTDDVKGITPIKKA